MMVIFEIGNFLRSPIYWAPSSKKSYPLARKETFLANVLSLFVIFTVTVAAVSFSLNSL